MSINKVILVGNVGKDPVVRYFDKGVAKASFPLATSETYTNQQGETITNTEWHNIVLWRSLAEVAEKTVKKGAQLYIIGKIKTRSYVDKDGNNKYITEILADTLLLLDKKQTAGTYQAAADSVKNDSVSSGSTANEINEPSPGYKSSDINVSASTDKENGSKEDFGNDNFPKNDSFPDQTEDDLPF